MSGAAGAMLATGIPYHSFPELVLGPLRLHTFGLFVMAGIAAGVVVAGRRNERYGIPRSDTERVGITLVVVGLIGARLAWVVTHRKEIHSPIDVIAVWNGGLQFSGGFVAAILLAPFITRSWPRVQKWALLDGAILGLAIGQCIGRFGCIAVGEHLGGPTSFFLGMHYLGGTVIEGPLTVGETYHNCAIYEVLWLIPLIAVLFWMDRRGTRPGMMSATFILSYAVLRFLTDMLRINDERVLGLTGAQYMCIALIPFGLWVLWTARRPDDTAPGDDAVPASGEATQDETSDTQVADSEQADSALTETETADVEAEHSP
jgi:phosphatidylglycerol---prolipoprotein diacylglyceryl transferase